jgi:hypothetical protein
MNEILERRLKLFKREYDAAGNEKRTKVAFMLSDALKKRYHDYDQLYQLMNAQEEKGRVKRR